MSLAESTAPPDPPFGQVPPAGSLSPLTRAARVFTNPARAWDGLDGRRQWWFPLLLILAVEVTLSASTFHRALLPDMLERWDQAVANGQMPPDRLENLRKFFTESWV